MTIKRLTRFTLALALAGFIGAVVPLAVPAAGSVAAAKAGGKAKRKKIRKVLRKAGLAKLPSVSNTLAGHGGRTRRGHLVSEDVVGTPPALVDIPGMSIKDLFWQPGVIDAIANGSPTPEQCGQFYYGSHDGDSGGMGACQMTESVGYSFGNIIQGDTSLCYMKRFPTPENVSAGAVSVLSGTLPDGDITRLFSVPTGANPRLVKVSVSGDEHSQDVFLRVSPEDENQAEHNFYKVTIWFCRGDAQPTGFNRITIGDSGTFESVDNQMNDGNWTGNSTVTGSLTFNAGQMSFDTTKSRRAQVESASGNQSFKSDVEIASDNSIAIKLYETYGSSARKAFLVTSFTGSTPDAVRFLAGAFKDANSNDGVNFGDSFQGSSEYRNSFYAASPGSVLEADLASVDLGSDTFYAAPASPSVDVSGMSCDATPDVQVALDFANPAAASVKQTCENRKFQQMHFCHDDSLVSTAEMSFFSKCNVH
jgi:hypothetical protein